MLKSLHGSNRISVSNEQFGRYSEPTTIPEPLTQRRKTAYVNHSQKPTPRTLYLTLYDFNYDENLLDAGLQLYQNFYAMLSFSKFDKDRGAEMGRQEIPSQSWPWLLSLRSALQRYQDLVTEYTGPILQAFVASQLVIYLLTLVFSYEELFTARELQQPRVLSVHDLTLLNKLCSNYESENGEFIIKSKPYNKSYRSRCSDSYQQDNVAGQTDEQQVISDD